MTNVLLKLYNISIKITTRSAYFCKVFKSEKGISPSEFRRRNRYIPNVGQIPNLPLGVIVETNATFRSDGFKPVMAGSIPDDILPLISRAAFEKLNMRKHLESSQKREFFV